MIKNVDFCPNSRGKVVLRMEIGLSGSQPVPPAPLHGSLIFGWVLKLHPISLSLFSSVLKEDYIVLSNEEFYKLKVTDFVMLYVHISAQALTEVFGQPQFW